MSDTKRPPCQVVPSNAVTRLKAFEGVKWNKICVAGFVKRFLLRSNDPAEGGENNPPPNPNPAPPPAGKIVKEGEITEREVQLQAQLDAEKEARKQAEMKAGQFEDQVNTLKQQQTDAAWKYRPFKLS